MFFSILSLIFNYDYRINAYSETRSPQHAAFLAQVLTQLDHLKLVELDKGDNLKSLNTEGNSSLCQTKHHTEEPMEECEETKDSEEEKHLIRLCKTSNLIFNLFLTNLSLEIRLDLYFIFIF